MHCLITCGRSEEQALSSLLIPECLVPVLDNHNEARHRSKSSLDHFGCRPNPGKTCHLPIALGNFVRKRWSARSPSKLYTSQSRPVERARKWRVYRLEGDRAAPLFEAKHEPIAVG